jgi:hypothetical protein
LYYFIVKPVSPNVNRFFNIADVIKQLLPHFLFYFVLMKKTIYLLLISFYSIIAIAQTTAEGYSKFTTAQNRTKFYNDLVNHSITQNLSLPLNDETEENWQEAFSAIELINYRQANTNATIKIAVDSMEKRSPSFQQSLLEMLYANGQLQYSKNVFHLLANTNNAKIFAICAEYLLLTDTSKKLITGIKNTATKNTSLFTGDKNIAIMLELFRHLNNVIKKPAYPVKQQLKTLFDKNYLKGKVVVYSIQRKNRNYPGIVIVKDTAGNFMRNNDGRIFSLPQFARSLSNFPAYLSNGNTPQGIYRLYGFGSSRSPFIGPTENLQLSMPYETSLVHFFKDSSITDTIWSKEWYSSLLPATFKNYDPFYETLNASETGRTEIISHGTAVDPSFYKGQIYYPYTPTAGCLSTKEIWDASGKLIFSDQQKLVDAVKKAGGADGYLIVIELNDAQKTMTADELLPCLPN